MAFPSQLYIYDISNTSPREKFIWKTENKGNQIEQPFLSWLLLLDDNEYNIGINKKSELK